MNDLTPGRSVRFTNAQLQELIGEKRTAYIHFAFGLAILNQDTAQGVQWVKSVDAPSLQIPENAWLHSVLLSGFSTFQNPTGDSGLMESLMGFPVNMTMFRVVPAATLLNVNIGTGQGSGGNANFQQMALAGRFIMPVGVRVVFEPGEVPIGSEMGLIQLNPTEPWFLGNPDNARQGAIGLGAQITLAY